ncbi:MAG: citrate (Si)-synthase [Spirochaetes bacterium GWF1_31_7]|nr:MAG: citrate (Si)-synthase [Spirochaetes bacterium GWE1_32_154]OHD51320.1 MAG: citrate (Si)-synthase [Spirochaetes bacterium GWE2_31_10]OHD51517.1 MAG: citrate (Si)-synthase [Spirochaetes bacterium GWF1_31_7]HBD95866.1 citrate (Si)-synthase [Spirochaetia bacterium]HBI38142.1 citrate (Si)-synthase [Spirochaetia bacterium]
MNENEDSVELRYKDHVKQLKIIQGTDGNKAVDISNLKQETGFITYDPGYQNTSAYKSGISFVDGEKGILRYRGIPIEELATKSTFVETAYLLIYGNLPEKKELHTFSRHLNEYSLLHEDMVHFFHNIPQHAHPMATLSMMVNGLSIFYKDAFDLEGEFTGKEPLDITIARLISIIRTIAAFSYKKYKGEPFVYPRPDLKYCANFLNMMFSNPVNPYEIADEDVKLLNILLTVHADHEQNCSTSTVKLVGSSRVNLYASICSGICALWGPLHGGANQKVIEMLYNIKRDNLTIKDVLEKAKRKSEPYRLMGVGHRVYKTFDPRAKILKDICATRLTNDRRLDPYFEIALELEHSILKDDYFIERNLYPNVDFYSGLLYRSLGIPTNMFTVMFAIGRIPGWIAQWKEMRDSTSKIGRPRQVYVGNNLDHYVPLDLRGQK